MVATHQRIEPISDLGLLFYWIEKTGIVSRIDEYYPSHGNWQGPSLGKVLLVFLVYILSESDHRQSLVENWVSLHLHSIRYFLDFPSLEAKHFNDDRIGLLLEKLSEDESWEDFSQAHSKHLLEVFDLSALGSTIRLDSVNAGSFRSAEGLFRMGFSKQHRSDIPQIKMMMSSLDPLAIPISTHIVAGNKGDDLLYQPTIEQVWKTLPPTGLLYVGDSKMGNLSNRSFIVGSENYYLVPLNLIQYSSDLVNQGIEQALAEADSIIDLYGEGVHADKLVARIFELSPRQVVCKKSGLSWEERLILNQSPDRAKRQKNQLLDHLEQAYTSLINRFTPKRGRHKFKTREDAKKYIQKTLSKYQVKDLLSVELKESTQLINHKAVGKKAAWIEEKKTFKVIVERKDELIKKALQRCGWNVYATNASIEKFSATEVTKCYRSQYRIEQKFNELLNKTTALKPIFLSLQNRIVALIRVLFLAIQLATLMQYQLREKLKEQKKSMKGLIPGNLGRAVERPTIKLILNKFKGIFIGRIYIPEIDQTRTFIDGFKPIHQAILKLLNIPPEIYTKTDKFFEENYLP